MTAESAELTWTISESDMEDISEVRTHAAETLRGKKWPQTGLAPPWFDRPDALEVLEQRLVDGRYDEDQYALLRKWIVDGYVVVSDLLDARMIDGMLEDLDRIWIAKEPVDGLRIEELRLRDGDPPGVAHRDLLELDLDERLRLRDSSIWRTHGFYLFSANARSIFEEARLRDLCSLIFDAPAEPQYTINFMYGSRQGLHQDTAVFHVHPPNYLIGAWLACEDISPDSGPLVYYPGSHKEGLFERFDNYPQTNLKTCSQDVSEAYYRWLDERSRNYERKQFLAKKGDVLLWHGLLIHGGDQVNNPGLTRKSYVCHYIAEGRNKHSEIEGPFNW